MADPMPPQADYRSLAAAVAELQRQITELQQPTGTQQTQAVKKLKETQAAMPFTDMTSHRESGFALGSGWRTVATVSIPIPEDKTTAQIVAIASGAALDTTSGGLTTVDGRVLIHGDAGGKFPAAKDAGASVVNNVIVATHSRSGMDVSGLSSVQVQFQMQPLNPSAFPSNGNNFADLTAIATFTG